MTSDAILYKTTNKLLAATDGALGFGDYHSEWEGGRYDLKYQRIGDRWYITEIRLIEISPTGTPRPTPNMSLSPMPAVTNTPSVTPTPSATPSMSPSPTPSAVAVPEETPEDDNA